MPGPNDQHGIENEPHLRGGLFYDADPSELRSAGVQADELERVEHTVWDEPTLAPELREHVAPDITYQSWLARKIEQTTWLDSWAVTLLVACVAGPWGVMGAFAGAVPPVLCYWRSAFLGLSLKKSPRSPRRCGLSRSGLIVL